MNKIKMWDHYCPIEETEMSVGKHEECNWCGATEDSDWDARPECSFGDEDEKELCSRHRIHRLPKYC